MRTQKSKNLTPAEKYRIAKLYRENMPLKHIEELMHRDRKVIYRALDALNVPRRSAISKSPVRRKKTTETLCWYCQRASAKPCDQCEWVMAFKPVPGWEVRETICDTTPTQEVHSYHVENCPKFIKDKPRRVPAI